MKPDDIQAALADIRGTGDELIKNLKLAGLLGTLFKEKGWELVMVGGSAIEVYTEGRYMSGDIDMCGKMGMPPPKIKAEVMASLGATGGPRNFRLDDRWIDLLGQVERMSPATYQVIETAYGEVTLMPVEELLVDRVFTSVYPQANDEAKACAEKLMAVCISGAVATDWEVAAKMANSKEYGIGKEFIAFKDAIAQRLAKHEAPKNEQPKDNSDMGTMDRSSGDPEIGI